ncbi:MAG TPA: class I SAM-dependent methyltransferase [Stellaceae bacterium]
MAPPTQTSPPLASLTVDKFEQRPPAQRNAVDIFAGKWASDLTPIAPGVVAGAVPAFSNGIRMRDLAEAFGQGGRLDGMSVLELGPLEGGHTYHLERLGAASILAIESNVEAYLKCLVTKELAGLRNARFLLGDFVPYLETTAKRYDIVLCSGVLYHMAAPFRLIDALPRVTSKCFVWTHYYDAANYRGPPRRPVTDPARPGIEMYLHDHQDRRLDTFWGGNKPVTMWLKRQDILDGFAAAGFDRVTVIDEDVANPNSACFAFTAERS